MTTHAIIRNGLRTLVASFLATCLLAVWPQSAQAGKSGGGHVQHKEFTITKQLDKATPVMAKKKPTGTSKGKVEYMKFEMKDSYISGYSR
jgi:type VI protein secretion system component Hcp